MADQRRYTTAELDAMEQEAVKQGMNPEAAKGAAESLTSGMESSGDFGGGFKTSLERTLLGLKQLGAYMTGNDEDRVAINEAIKRLEQRPELQTSAGRMGEAAGTMTQFAGPQGAASATARMLPRAVVGISQRYIGKPGSVGRAAGQGAAYEAAQPMEMSDADTGEFVTEKAGRTAAGAGGAALVGKVGKSVTSPGVPIAAERKGVTAEAERLGIKLTPAQRTGDVTLSQFEEGLASRPGSAKIILDAREAQQAVMNKKAAEAIGSKAPAPNEAVLAEQTAIARKGYDPIKSIDRMSWDAPYITDLDKFINKQATKATGSVDAAKIAEKLKHNTAKYNGDVFLEELQGVRDMAFGARTKGDVATAKQLNDLSEIMEDYAERRVARLAKLGQISPDAMAQFREARTAYAKIHAIEKATEPVSGKVSALKYLNQEFKRNPASRGKSTAPTATGLEDVGATARVLKQVTPYIGSSGTAERIAGQQLVEATGGPFAAIRAAGPIMKNYLAAKYYMKYGGQPGMLGDKLTPTQNMYVRRLLPDVGFAMKEGAD